jgi:signal transduction histidine kinase/DNA-binding response OmpR family regulator/CHASE3 domain sensor protein
MLQRWSSKNKRAAGLALVLAFLLVNMAISFQNLRRVVDNGIQVTHTHEELAELQDALSSVQDIETGMRGYVITGDERYLKPYNTAVAHMERSSERLRALIVVQEVRRHLPALESEIGETLATSQRVVELRRGEGFEAASGLVRSGLGKREMDNVRHTIAAMASMETELLRQRNIESQASTQRALLTFIIALLVSLGLVALAYYMIGRAAAQRQRAAADLKAIENFSRNIVDTVREPLLTLDSTLRVHSANRAFYQTFHVSPDETENRLIYELGNGQWDIPNLRTLLEDVVPKSSVFNDFELEHTFPVIGRRVMLLNARKLQAAHHGELLVLAMEDVTERRRVEEEVVKAKEAAETANKTKSLFLANMSHELRTPLNAILGYSEMLHEEAVDKDLDEFSGDLEKINAAGKHLLTLIDDILDLSKIEAGKMDLLLDNFDVAEMIDEVASTIRPLVEKNANTLHIGCAPDLGVMHADLTKVRQVLFNLLSNAAKFTHDGLVTLDASRRRMDESEWIVFCISDTGIGLSSEQILKLFQAFTQADASTTRKFGGSGLGLALTRRFCQLMGGDVTVHSVPGEGSVFTITLPAVVNEVKSEAPPETESGPQESVAAESCVLVIDDNPGQRDLMQRFLSKEGFCVRAAAGGVEGLRLARQLRPAAITLDVMMPDMDGWSVLSALKADAELCHIPVIMLTMVDDCKQGFTLGASDYATKPVDRHRLSTILKKYACPNPPCPVLLIEGDPATREVTRAILEKEGWRVREAQNRGAAIECMELDRPSLIVMDLMGPEMDGFEFAALVRKQDEWRSIPIVVLTAHDLSSEELLRLNGFIEKILPQEEGDSREVLLHQVRDLLADCTAPRQTPTTEPKGGEKFAACA